jgi:L-erythro-3,5-diaminohexanoate dehydrogenase
MPSQDSENPGDPFGTHRTLDPKGTLPQQAWRLDNDFSRLFEGELLLAVETLNVDAASFRQMEDETAKRGEAAEAGVARQVLETVQTRGKQHNPVTGSGGMLLGRPGFSRPHRGGRRKDRLLHSEQRVSGGGGGARGRRVGRPG